MIRHALKLAFRNYRQQKGIFFINIVGLSTGLACALLIFLWVSDELSVDAFHEKDDRLFIVLEHQQYDENIMTTRSTPGLLAQTLKEEIPEIELSSTIMWQNKFTLTIGEKNIKSFGHHADVDFFQIFTYPLLYGKPDEVLKDNSSIVISESLAKNLFGQASTAMGQIIEYDHTDRCIVTGIFEDIPSNSTYEFDVILPYQKYLKENQWLANWGSNSPPTFVVLKPNVDPQSVSDKIANFVKDRNENSNVTLFLNKFSDMYLYGQYENGVQDGGRIDYVKLFSIIALFILLIACINFMNLSTARGALRAREVGVKKTFGVQRELLIFQYLAESTIIAFIALLFALGLVFAFLPTFNLITDKEIGYSFSLTLILSFVGITFLTGLVAGSYPALYLSSFKPVRILKGELKSSVGEIFARKGLVVFQFTLSLILIISVLVVYHQIQYVQTKNVGYDKEQLINFTKDGKLEENDEAFLHQVKQLPSVINAASIAHDLVGRQNNTSGLHWEGKDPNERILFEHVRVGHDLLKTIGVNLVAGRDFSREFGQDTAKIIFNETAIAIMGLDNPIGKTIRLWDEYDMEIIGIVEDFHFQSLHEPVKPLFFRLAPDNTWVFMAKLATDQVKEGVKDLQALYERFNPGYPFDYRFVDDEYAKQYAAEMRVSKLSRYFAGLAILISCLGLFGLAAFTGERRKKEIGVRKVLGANILNIILLLSKDFTKLVVFSIFIGFPIAYFILSKWLTRFEFHIDLTIWHFLITGFLLLIIAWLTVGYQAYKAASILPVESIKEH